MSRETQGEVEYDLGVFFPSLIFFFLHHNPSVTTSVQERLRLALETRDGDKNVGVLKGEIMEGQRSPPLSRSFGTVVVVVVRVFCSRDDAPYVSNNCKQKWVQEECGRDTLENCFQRRQFDLYNC